MTDEFNRRGFLKAGAAGLGATFGAVELAASSRVTHADGTHCADQSASGLR